MTSHSVNWVSNWNGYDCSLQNLTADGVGPDTTNSQKCIISSSTRWNTLEYNVL